MIQVRPNQERGRTTLPWLDSRHSFSFGDYHDPRHMNFGALRVINEDRVAAGGGFPTHSHRDMEIVTYVLAGELAHRDSTGTSSVIRVGDVQRMSAGAGISHSEFNNSKELPVHFLQIWLLPDRAGLTPSYEQQTLKPALAGAWQLVASRDGHQGSLTVHQDVNLFKSSLGAGEEISFECSAQRQGWLQVLRGEMMIDGQTLQPGDGAAITQQRQFVCATKQGAEAMLFDLA